MAPSTPATFGPYLIKNAVAGGPLAELDLASLFGLENSAQLVMLRRVRADHPRAERLNRDWLDAAGRYALLKHPGVIEVKDFGTFDGRSYLATEYIRGRSLQAALAACGRLGLGFPTDVALYIVSEVLDALEYAHSLKSRGGAPLSTLHGDVRHSNVVIAFDGTVRLGDFGMGIGSTHPRTERGVCIGGRQGYYSYLAPEQARQEAFGASADIFSLGVVLYELVTGRHLFSDQTENAIFERLLQGAYDLPIARYRPDLHPELESIIRTAVAPDPTDRFASASSFKQALSSFLLGVGVAAGQKNVHELMERLFGAEQSEPDLREDDGD